MDRKQKALAAVFVGSLLGGATTSITKIGLFEIPPLTFAFIRFFIASILLLPFFLRSKEASYREIIQLVPLSLLATGNITLFILAIEKTTATIGQLLYAATPLLTVIITYILFQKKVMRGKLAGVLLGFLGVAIVVLLPVIESNSKFSGDLFANLLIAVGVILWSLYMVLSKKKLSMHSPFVINVAFVFTSTAVLLPLFILENTIAPSWVRSIHEGSLLSLLYVSTIATIGTYYLNQLAIKHGSALLASLSFYLLPIFAFIAAFFLLGEQLTTGIVVGSVLTLCGVFLVTK